MVQCRMGKGSFAVQPAIGETVESIVRIIRSRLGPDFRVLLFGSWAKARSVTTSDIDIAIDGKQKVDDIIMASIRDEIDSLPTLRKVDLIDLHDADGKLKETILAEGRELA